MASGDPQDEPHLPGQAMTAGMPQDSDDDH
ncbi:hypothetical protein HMPREF9702_02186 [Delftia acidovorans CCUG 15835]|jgi:hypothetical protein|nr:hypothetical protein HMPREF9702_02186 [Delftia acidovorans CCUG 15835]SFB66229.1 hypothetical protein SAMN05444579_1432 [Delftia tsuruhatensis]